MHSNGITMIDKLSFSLGKWSGIPVTIHFSCTIAFLIFLILNGWEYAAVYAIAMFCVLIHELGHCFMARKFRIYTDKIVLYAIGGAASIPIDRKNAKQEFWVALAGPMTSLLLAVIFFIVSLVVGPGYKFPSYLVVINLIFAVFNLIPAWPMDGGRIFRSIMMFFTKNIVLSMNVTFYLAVVCCIIMFIAGIAFNQLFMPFIALMILFASRVELGRVRQSSIQSWEQRIFIEDVEPF